MFTCRVIEDSSEDRQSWFARRHSAVHRSTWLPGRGRPYQRGDGGDPDSEVVLLAALILRVSSSPVWGPAAEAEVGEQGRGERWWGRRRRRLYSLAASSVALSQRW